MTFSVKKFEKHPTQEINQQLYEYLIYHLPISEKEVAIYEKTARTVKQEWLTLEESEKLASIMGNLTLETFSSAQPVTSQTIKDYGLIVYRSHPYFIEDFCSEVSNGKIPLEGVSSLFLFQDKICTIEDEKDPKDKPDRSEISEFTLVEFFHSPIAMEYDLHVEHIFDFLSGIFSANDPFRNIYLQEPLNDSFIEKICDRFSLDVPRMLELWDSDRYHSEWYNEEVRKYYRSHEDPERRNDKEYTDGLGYASHEFAWGVWKDHRKEAFVSLLPLNVRNAYVAYHKQKEGNAPSKIATIAKKVWKILW